jgi:hypothetical protein
MLFDAAFVSSTDVWAVGRTDSNGLTTLIEQWNGSTWQIVPSPNVGTQGSGLSGAAALSDGEAWVVGTYVDASGQTKTLVEQICE